MNEDFVTYEQAVKLKELGFDWECFYFYDKNKKFRGDSINSGDESIIIEVDDFKDNWNFTPCNKTTAPTLAQVQKWLYEKFGWWLIPIMARENKFIFDITDKYAEPIEQSFETFDTPFMALSAGIDKVLELLKEQSNGNQD